LSKDDELEAIKKKKLEQIRQQAQQQKLIEAQKKEFENKKYQIMRQILSPEGRQRLENIRMVKPEFAEQIELQLIQLYQTKQLRGSTPLSDKTFKKLLEQISNLEKKKEFKIKK
jgi:programmed cell death protein 5